MAILNPEGHLNRITGSKVKVILLNWWILPIGGASSGRVCACSLRSRLVFRDIERNPIVSEMRVKCRQFSGRPLTNTLYPDIFLNTPVSVQSSLGRDNRFRFSFVILIVLLRMQGEEWCPATGSSWPPCRALPGGCWRRAGSGPGTS